jgi:hypothetical protein
VDLFEVAVIGIKSEARSRASGEDASESQQVVKCGDRYRLMIAILPLSPPAIVYSIASTLDELEQSLEVAEPPPTALTKFRNEKRR